MKINDILNLKKIETDKNNFISRLSYEEDLFGITNNLPSWINFEEMNIQNNRLKVYLIFEEMTDYRRGVWLYSAYFDDEPIAFWYEAGREGDDSKCGYILNKKKIIECVRYLEIISNNDASEYYRETDINKNLEELNEIYGFDMSKKLFDHNFDLKFKVNEIISFEDLHSLYEEIPSNEKNYCKIINKDNKSNYKTYFLELLNYKLVPFYSKERNSSKYRLFKKTDVLNFSDISDIQDEWEDFDNEQKEIIKDSISKQKIPTFTINYEEEKMMIKVENTN